MASALLFDFSNKIITVPIADSSLDLQFLIDEIRSAEHGLAPGMAYNKIADAYGKQDLGGGLKVGITVVLLDGWRVAFEARTGPATTSVTITGGNFVGEAGANPIAPTPYTQVTISQSTSATLVSSASDTNLVYLVESLRAMHPAFGSAFFWDPDFGNDGNDGTSPTTAVRTFATAQSLATSGRNDVIFCRPTGNSGTTICTETLNITKSNLKVRGPGIMMQLIPATTSSPTVNIGADHVEFSGFYLETAATGGQNAFTVNGDNVMIRDCWIGKSQHHGVAVSSSARFRLLTTAIENCTNSGIELGTGTTQALISKAIISGSSSGIVLSGTSLSDNILENCLIYNNSNYGVDIGSGAARTTVRGGSTITSNAVGNTRDLGIDTYIETPAGGASASDIADAVWNENMASHPTPGSSGKILQIIKSKATLSSIKK